MSELHASCSNISTYYEERRLQHRSVLVMPKKKKRILGLCAAKNPKESLDAEFGFQYEKKYVANDIRRKS